MSERRFRVRSRVLLDVEHVVEAESANLARQAAGLCARDLALKCRAQVSDEHFIAYTPRDEHDGLVVCELGEHWVECRPWSTTPGMRDVVTFLGECEPGLDRLELGHDDHMLLRRRLKKAGFKVLSMWTDAGGPDAATAVSFQLDRQASITPIMAKALCAPRPIDRYVLALDIEGEHR